MPPTICPQIQAQTQTQYGRSSPAVFVPQHGNGYHNDTGHRNEHCDDIATPPFLSVEELDRSSLCDHDYEELASRHNSINEQNTSKLETTAVGNGSGPGPCFQMYLHVPHSVQNSTPPNVPERGNNTPCDHDYDEPNFNLKSGKEIAVLRNGSSVVNRNSHPLPLSGGTHNPIIKRRSSPATVAVLNVANLSSIEIKQEGEMKTNSRVKDYEVPVLNSSPTQQEATNGITSCQPLASKLNKAKSMRAVMRQSRLDSPREQSSHLDTPKKHRSMHIVMQRSRSDTPKKNQNGFLDKELTRGDQTEARESVPNSKGSSPSEQSITVSSFWKCICYNVSLCSYQCWHII